MNRRHFHITAGLAAFGLYAPAGAAGGGRATSYQSAVNAAEFGVRPGIPGEQSAAFIRMLSQASGADTPIFLPPGIYRLSNITLPQRVRLLGVAGATRLLYGGDGHMLQAENAERVALTGLVVDGADRWLDEDANGLVDLRGVGRLAIDDCEIIASGKHGIAVERTAGRIERCTVTGAAEAGIHCVSADGMRIAANTVADCGNGGILVHRWEAGEDGTLISENRIERTRADRGGTGPFGNGINVYLADNVTVANNHVADSAFSAIRANSASNITITSNTCLRSGETAVYSEFAFQGAVISSNIVDGAANGISMVNFNEGGRMGTCTGNLVRNLSSRGPYPAGSPGFGTGIAVEADATVTGNVVEDAPLFGMTLGWGPFLRNVVASGNVIRKAGTGIAVSVVEGSGTAVVTGNIIEGAREAAIRGYRWAEPVTGELAQGGDSGYRHLAVEGNQAS